MSVDQFSRNQNLILCPNDCSIAPDGKDDLRLVLTEQEAARLVLRVRHALKDLHDLLQQANAQRAQRLGVEGGGDKGIDSVAVDAFMHPIPACAPTPKHPSHPRQSRTSTGPVAAT